MNSTTQRWCCPFKLLLGSERGGFRRDDESAERVPRFRNVPF